VHIDSEKSAVNVQIVQCITEFEWSENVYFLSMYVNNGLWKADAKAIGLQMAILNCPITIVAYFEQVPWDRIDRSQHRNSFNSTIPGQKSILDGKPNSKGLPS